MDGIVLELQKEALNKDADIELLLRKAYVIAKKLKLKDFEEWVQLEQNGYGIKEVPEYRYIKGQIKARNPYYGWIPVVLNIEYENLLSNIPVKEAVSSLIDLYNSDNDMLMFSMNAEITQTLSKLTNFETIYCVQFGKSQIYRILSTIQNKILDWALLLEENNIIGKGLSFSDSEIEKAKQTATINSYTNNFYANVDNMDIQQGGIK
ncbi:MAG: hypothetical protein IKJ01_00440 [Lachnospiraceae bacterium]|nr:hypothetical protein [Lachnospiraceae bacterium]